MKKYCDCIDFKCHITSGVFKKDSNGKYYFKGILNPKMDLWVIVLKYCPFCGKYLKRISKKRTTK